MPLTKAAMTALVTAGVNEQVLQSALKQDLSAVAEVYAFPKEEFIAFSEFPINQGSVDFVVLTSRSKMMVYFVEVKGANFDFLNQDCSIAAPINLAAQQVRRRLTDFHKNYEPSRRFMHDERVAALQGKGRYNAFVGPDGLPHVDPNKDVDTYGVVIGGRTTDDLTESKVKYDLEWNSTPRIKHESWDSWLRKLVRA